MTPRLRESPLLTPGTALLPRDTGWLLRTADGTEHTVLLDEADTGALLDALVTGTLPALPAARRALQALVLAGHAVAPDADPAPRVAVSGAGPLAAAVVDALRATGAVPVAPGEATTVVHLLDATPGPTGPPAGELACWVEGHRLVLTPVAVSAPDTAARHRAAHRPAAPTEDGVVSGRPVPSPRARVLAAALIATEAVRRAEIAPAGPRPVDRDDHLATVLDLLTLHVTRHPVLPVPPVPA